jgi:multiple antibiotic resistance protein
MFATFTPILFTIFVVIDPLGLVPLYIGLCSPFSERERNKVIRTAVLTAVLVLGLFILAGRWMLDKLGVSPGSFYIAGGIMLFLVSLDMLFGKERRSKTSEAERGADSGESGSPAVFPLAIPMLAGPGAISAILLFNTADAPQPLTAILVAAACLITLAIAALAMKLSAGILRVLGRTGVSVLERIMGLLLSGMSVQFVYDGLVRLSALPGALR